MTYTKSRNYVDDMKVLTYTKVLNDVDVPSDVIEENRFRMLCRVSTVILEFFVVSLPLVIGCY